MNEKYYCPTHGKEYELQRGGGSSWVCSAGDKWVLIWDDKNTARFEERTSNAKTEPKNADELADIWLYEGMEAADQESIRNVLIAIAFSLQAISEKMDKINDRLQ